MTTKKRRVQTTLTFGTILALSVVVSSASFAGEKEIEEAAKILRRFHPLNTHAAAGRGYLDAAADKSSVKAFTTKVYLGLPISASDVTNAVDDIESRTTETMGFIEYGTPKYEIVTNLEVAPHIQVWHRAGPWGIQGTRKSGYVDAMVMLDLINFQMVELVGDDRKKVLGDLPETFQEYYHQISEENNQKLLEIGYYQKARRSDGVVYIKFNENYNNGSRSLRPEHASLPELRLKQAGAFDTSLAHKEYEKALSDRMGAIYKQALTKAGTAPGGRELSLREVAESLFEGGERKTVYLAEDYLPAVMRATKQASDEVMGLKRVLVTSWLAGAGSGTVTEESFDRAYAAVYKGIEHEVFFPVPPTSERIKAFACPALLAKDGGKTSFVEKFARLFSKR